MPDEYQTLAQYWGTLTRDEREFILTCHKDSKWTMGKLPFMKAEEAYWAVYQYYVSNAEEGALMQSVLNKLSNHKYIATNKHYEYMRNPQNAAYWMDRRKHIK